jgi:uncharacterized Fe-S cluster protein YjdI
VFTPGFVFLVGSVFPFSRTCVHSRFCFLGGICLTLPKDLCSLQVLFSWLGSVLPFPRICVHSRFCCLGGFCLTLPEDLCSLQVLFFWWGLSYPSLGSVFTPGFVFLVGSVLPFRRTCVHSGFCFLGGGPQVLEKGKTDPTKKTKPGVNTDLREGKDRSHQENKTWSEHRSSGKVRQTPPSKQNLE